MVSDNGNSVAKTMKQSNLSKSQKNLLDIVKHLDRQKRGAQQAAEKPSTLLEKGKLSATVDPRTAAGG
jgi:hypothetical protein